MWGLNAEGVAEVAVGHRVISDCVGHVGGDPNPVVVDAVGQVLPCCFAGWRDRPQAVADESQPLRAAAVEGGIKLAADFRFDRTDTVGVERLRGRGHLGVMEAELLLEADQLKQAAWDAGQSVRPVAVGVPAILGDGIKLVFETEDRLVVVEGAVAQLRQHEVGVGRGVRPERFRVDSQHVADGRCQRGLCHRAGVCFQAS